MKKGIILSAVLLLVITLQAGAQIISTFAGTVTSGYTGDGGIATSAELFHPKGAVADDTGNVYIADADNNVIRKVNRAGIITTIAGLPAGGFSGDGFPAVFALMNRPNSIAIDRRGNMYICDADNQRVRKINASGIISTVVGDGTAAFFGDGGPATAAEINYPGSIALDDTGNLYIADEYNNRIRKVDTFGVITTFAGSGSTGYSGEGGNADLADIGFPFGVAADHAGNVYFSLTLGNRICGVNTAHVITTVAGTGGPGAYSGDGGPATAADFDTPWGLSVDPSGNLYITDNANERIRVVYIATGNVYTVAGNGSSGYSGDGGLATSAKLKDPAGVYVDNGGAMYIADYNNHRVRKVSSPFTHAPFFTGGHSQPLYVCENATAASIDSVLHVNDTDAGQYETWSVASAPAHGTLVAYYNKLSTGGILIPAGLSYTPTTGYTGADLFRVRIFDGISADTTTIHVTVSSCTTGFTNLAAVGAENKILPNPNDGVFTISLYAPADEQALVTITDMMGRKVKEMSVLTNKPMQIQLNEPSGVYFLDAATAHGKWNEKVVISR